MLDRRELLNRLIEGVGVREEESVSVRETYWGYIIHSTKPGSERAMRDMFFRLIMASSWIAVIGIWIAPAQMFPASPLFLKLALSVLLLGISYAALALCRPPAGYEFQVDANKREVRTAILNSKGERRGINKASFWRKLTQAPGRFLMRSMMPWARTCQRLFGRVNRTS